MIYLEANAEVVSRRPTADRVCVNLGYYRGDAFVRRPAPSRPQFSGAVELGDSGVPGSRVVQLRTRDGTVVDEQISDPVSGAFEFGGWYSQRDDYELHVIGDNYVSKSFPTLAPAELTWRGNPRVVSSDDNPSPPPWPPDALQIYVLSQSAPVAIVGEEFEMQMAAKNQVSTVTWSISAGALPPGLSINPSTGKISGTVSD